MDNSNFALKIEDLAVEFRTHERTVYAVNGLNLEIKKGSTLGLVGETGAGKTTIGLAILSLIQSPPGIVTDGSIAVDGNYVYRKLEADEREAEQGKKRGGSPSQTKLRMSDRELKNMRGNQVSMIFQDPMTSLNPALTVENQIAEVIANHKTHSRNEALKEARNMLELVGIPSERGQEYPHQFSGGMKQRVVIAMALACHPDLLIADEPTTALDVTIQAQVLDMMKNLQKQNGTAMLMITHDLGIVAEVCDYVSVIYAGKIVEHGSLEDVFDHTLHPYTQGLFNSLPNMRDRKARLKPIKGLMPDPSVKYVGCAFAERCQYATEKCFTELPTLCRRNDEHYVVCHLYDPENVKEGGVLSDA